jgi:dTMP kinase
MSTIKGKFLTLEGVDASGKSTNIQPLAEHLRSRGYKVHVTREPGGSPAAEAIRGVLLNKDLEMSDATELLLFLAARRDHVEKVIKPYLEKGYVVISDRFSDTMYAYQGHARGLSEMMLSLEQTLGGEIEPDYTLFFDIPFEESCRRLAARTEKQDRMDLQASDFRRRCFDGYQIRFKENQHRMHRIDALPNPKVVKEKVLAWANAVFENLN